MAMLRSPGGTAEDVVTEFQPSLRDFSQAMTLGPSNELLGYYQLSRWDKVLTQKSHTLGFPYIIFHLSFAI